MDGFEQIPGSRFFLGLANNRFFSRKLTSIFFPTPTLGSPDPLPSTPSVGGSGPDPPFPSDPPRSDRGLKKKLIRAPDRNKSLYEISDLFRNVNEGHSFLFASNQLYFFPYAMT